MRLEVKTMRKKSRAYKRHKGANPPGRPPGEVAALAEREGISRQLAWYRLNKRTGKPPGRPKKKVTRRSKRRDPLAALGAMD